MDIEVVHLVITASGETTRQSIGADQLEGLILGRSQDAGLVLNDPTVSRRHCLLQQVEGRLEVEDLGSSSGVAINGLPIEGRSVLHHRDQLTLGAVSMQVLFASRRPRATKVPAAGGQATLMVGDSGAASPAEGDDSAPRTVRLGDHAGPVVFGRSPEATVRSTSLLVSKRHAKASKGPAGWIVRDLGSTNGTFISGARIQGDHLLRAGDSLALGPHRWAFDGELLRASSTPKGVPIQARELSKLVPNRSGGDPVQLLHEVSVSIPPGRFVGLLGPSGCGKSTLLDCLNGRRPSTSGAVLYGPDDLLSHFAAHRVSIGTVPQQLIFHTSLSVREILRFSSELRLSHDASPEDVEQNITRVLGIVGLEERADTVVRDLSGGQQKRVSLAIELLSQPKVLFLDEVTSGLDLRTERQMMQLFRQLADAGLTVVCITHHLDSLEHCDSLVCLVRGRLAFHGSPAQMREYFAVEEMADLFDRLDEHDSQEWETRFLASPLCGVDSSGTKTTTPGGEGRPGSARDWKAELREFRHQCGVLSRRSLALLRADRRMLAILLGLAAVVAGLLRILAGAEPSRSEPPSEAELRAVVERQSILAFGSVIGAFFLGLFTSVQELVRERDIYEHERFASLSTDAYLVSKALPLLGIAAVQAMLVAGLVIVGGGLEVPSLAFTGGMVLLSSAAGVLLGLAVSAGVPRNENSSSIAVMCMIAVVLPQVLFAGLLGSLSGVAEVLARCLVSTYWAFQGLMQSWESHTGLRPVPPIERPGAALCVAVLLLQVVATAVLLRVLMHLRDPLRRRGRTFASSKTQESSA